jgi:hypothetical protein
MNINKDCIHLKCRYLKVLNYCSKEIDHLPVFDQCDLNLINPLYGCNPNCASFESRKEL